MQKTELLQGTLDMLILKVLQREPIHGFGICQRIQQLSDEVLSVGEGSLYPALYRLQAMDVFADIGEQSRIAQLLQPEIINERGKGELALIEGAGANGENAASTADAADAWMMRRCGARAEGRRCDQSHNERDPIDHCPPLDVTRVVHCTLILSLQLLAIASVEAVQLYVR